MPPALLGSGSLKALLESREPIIVVVNGDAERIQAASRTRLMSMLFTTMLSGERRAAACWSSGAGDRFCRLRRLGRRSTSPTGAYAACY